MANPFFSVIVSSYNRSAQLRLALESIDAQTFRDFEILVIDDCSRDDTMLQLEKFTGERLRVFSTPVNSGGPAVPRNIGTREAKGEWVCFCDSDDRFAPEHLQIVSGAINNLNITDGIISANAFLLEGNKRTTRTYFPEAGQTPRKISFSENWKHNHAILSGLCIRNQSIVPFREDERSRSVEDYIFLLENMLSGKPHYFLPQATIHYNAGSGDSIRFQYNNGQRLYRHKLEILRNHRLWKRKNAIGLMGQIGIDYIKSTVGRLINRKVM